VGKSDFPLAEWVLKFHSGGLEKHRRKVTPNVTHRDRRKTEIALNECDKRKNTETKTVSALKHHVTCLKAGLSDADVCLTVSCVWFYALWNRYLIHPVLNLEERFY
jgi:hypothetical protein